MLGRVLAALLALALTGCPRDGSSSSTTQQSPGDASTSSGAAGSGAVGSAAQPPVAASSSRPDHALGGNLIVNPGVEAEFAVISRGADGDVVGPPGWELGGNVETLGYGHTESLGPETPGPTDRGDRYFQLLATGEGSLSENAAWQTIDVSSAAADIDAGGVVCALRGWFEGERGASAQLVAAFLDEAGTTLGEVKTAEAPYTERAALVETKAEGPVPAKTRKIRVTLQSVAHITDHSVATAQADSLELVLRKR
jgi:hypothetical protein